MEHREPEFATPHNFLIVPARRGMLCGRATWRNLNHNRSSSALAALARGRASCMRFSRIAPENLADSASSGLGRVSCLRRASRRVVSRHCLAHPCRYSRDSCGCLGAQLCLEWRAPLEQPESPRQIFLFYTAHRAARRIAHWPPRIEGGPLDKLENEFSVGGIFH